ncbi:ubiquitin carboxyl-hydrolase [Providencia alcalifaciens]|uniref:terminase small subunit-like protein n=1 Tax=Providencia alcalifaciens TaxID=126385 RepID=UPI0032DAB50A
MATKTKMGRPSDYLPEVADDICTLIADGESLRSVCKKKGMPNMTKIMRWLRENADFREQYAKAMESRADAVFEELFDIADDVAEEPAAISKAKLRIDTRKWALSRMSPKKYGDKITTELTGKDGGAIQYADITNEELEERLKELGHGRNRSQLDEKLTDS